MNEQVKHCVVAVCCKRNAWGRGQTVSEALKNMVKCGGLRSGAKLRHIVGDDKAYVDNMGTLTVHDGAVSYAIEG